MASGRNFVLEVIEEYRGLPCLWKVTDVNYHDKNKRREALEQLVALFKTKDKDSNKETVQKKIASMRSCFKKEFNKVRASARSGAGAGEVHIPKLWYYDHMLFLEDQEMARQSPVVASLLDDMPFGFDSELPDTEDIIVDNSPKLSSQSKCNAANTKSFKRTRAKADIVLEKIAKRLDNPPKSDKKKEKHAAFGEYLAEKLRSIPDNLIPICQKLMSDVMFNAEIGNLNYTSRIVTDLALEPEAHSSTADSGNSIMKAYYNSE